MSHNNQKKIAVINDFSGFGRCSIAVALPILSVMKVQCCPLPTSIFSNHTGFPSYFFEDYTSRMVPYMQEWKKLDLHFNGICSGFLGSKEQIEIVKKFFKEFKTEETQIIVDPVMGDYGKPYPTYTEEMCGEMKKLVEFADILTPNVTEACVLTDTPYKEKWKIEEIQEMAEKIHKMGPKKLPSPVSSRADLLQTSVTKKGSSRKCCVPTKKEHSVPEPAISLHPSLQPMPSTECRSINP